MRNEQNEKATYLMGENTCKNYVSDMWLIPKICEKLIQLSKTKIMITQLNMGREPE